MTRASGPASRPGGPRRRARWPRRRARLPRWSVDLAPLRTSGQFRLLWSSRTITLLGTQISQVALLVQARHLTGSAMMVGLLGAVEVVPLVVFGLYGGVLADRMDRRRLAVRAELGLALIAALLTVNGLLPRPLLWPLYACAAVAMALAALQRPSLDAAVPRLLPGEQLAAGSALLSLGTNAGAIVGPAIGGLLAAGPGPATAYAADAASFVISVILLIRLRPLPSLAASQAPSGESPALSPDGQQAASTESGTAASPESGTAASPESGTAASPEAQAAAGAAASGTILRDTTAGLRYALGRQDLLGSYLADLAAMLLAYPSSLFPFLAVQLHAGWAVGLMFSAEAAGALLVAAGSGWTGRVHRYGRAIALAAAVWGASTIGLALAPDIGVALAFLVLGGAADMLSGIFRSTLWNGTIPDVMRGRMAGVEVLSYSLGPSGGQIRAGAVADLIGTRTALWSGGVSCLAALGLTCLALPRFVTQDYASQDDGTPQPGS
jgi:MFS family permease